ncbi:ROK family transcriptional regulator [Agarivorans sp. Toyoura001]|uniref:ROK family transcriptional regulator n=1 Tax=unclassified Agarivorans TaxID=2636026 RepID=UPI0010DD8E34|nr:ROK family transcriptional regulator [Agarivorans sp. Toyoura001]GDY26918.1 transcriptional regulator [Agarivorans sp. Toyoura001]
MKKITDTELIRSANRREIIQTLRQHGELARVEIGNFTQLSPATITSITSELVQQGFIVEQNVVLDPSSGRGRPKVKLQLNKQAAFYLAVKLSINEVRFMLGDTSGAIIAQATLSMLTVTLNQSQLVDALSKAIEEFIQQHKVERSKLLGLGLAVQGVIEPHGEGILWSPAVKDQQLELVDLLAQQTQLPVFIANDANCLAVALKSLPRYSKVNNLVAIQLGYGVGMGLIVNGEFYQDAGSAATEFGHTKFSLNGPQCRCGGRGCIEAYVGDYAIYRDASAVYNLPPTDMLHPSEKQMFDLNKLAEDEHQAMSHIFSQAGTVLGMGLANVMALFNPQKIVISGPGVRAFDYMKESMTKTLSENLLPYHNVDNVVEKYNWDEDMAGIGMIAIMQQHTD